MSSVVVGVVVDGIILIAVVGAVALVFNGVAVVGVVGVVVVIAVAAVVAVVAVVAICVVAIFRAFQQGQLTVAGDGGCCGSDC